jgi:hypothetical protein
MLLMRAGADPSISEILNAATPSKSYKYYLHRDWQMAGLDESYIRQHLLDYARFQLKQGYMPDDLTRVFIKMGYHKNLVHSVIHDLTPGDIPDQAKTHDIKEMDESLSIYVENMLVDFIMKERKMGYEDPAIRRALARYGHHPKMIDRAFQAIKKGQVVDFSQVKLMQMNIQILLAVSMLLFFTFAVFLSISTNVSITVVLLSLAPSGAAVLAVYFICMFIGHTYRQLLPLLGVALALGSYMILAHMSPTLQGLPGAPVILGLNLVVAFILSAVFAFLSRTGDEEILEKRTGRKHEVLYKPQVPAQK